MEDTMLLKSSDGLDFSVLTCLEAQSKTIADLRKEVGDGDAIPLKDIHSRILRLIVAYMMYAKDLKPEIVVEEDPELKLDDPNHVLDKPLDLTEFEKEYIKDMDHGTLIEMMQATNYLNMEKLLRVIMRALALMYLGKTANDIYTLWGVDTSKPCDPNDPNVGAVTKEEEDEVIKENPWLADK